MAAGVSGMVVRTVGDSRDTARALGVTEGYYLFNAAPYLLPRRSLVGTPGDLSVTK